MGKVLVAWRDEEENGMAVTVFDAPADLDGDDLDRTARVLMTHWDVVVVADRKPLGVTVT